VVAYIYQEPHAPLDAIYGTDTLADFESGGTVELMRLHLGQAIDLIVQQGLCALRCRSGMRS
jgi:hypothetical protein